MDYYFVYENPPINWIQAEEICRDRYKSHLGSISTQRELNYIKSTLGYGELFIGLNDIKELPEYERLNKDDTIDKMLEQSEKSKELNN